MAQGINLLIGADVSKAVSELQKLNGFAANWGAQMRGHIVSAFSFYAAYQGIKNTVSAMSEFQAEMSKLKALTGETGAGLNRLRDNALGLAGAFKAIDIAKAQTDLSRAGFSTSEINNSIKAIIQLATATGEDLPKSAEIASATLRGFQLNSKEMTHVTDVMSMSFNKTALDLTSFAEAMKYVAPNARAANISLEETTAMLGILANNGIKGSMAGTALRRIIQDLSKDGRPLSERLAELGKNGLSAADAMDEIGRIGSTSLLILANSVPKINELNASLHNVAGETDRMAGVMMDNLAGDWRKLNAEWDKAIQKGTWLSDVLRSLSQTVTSDIAVLFNGNPNGNAWGDQFAKNYIASQKGNGATSSWGGRTSVTGEWNGPMPAWQKGYVPDFLKPENLKVAPSGYASEKFGGAWVQEQIELESRLNEERQNWIKSSQDAAAASQTFSDATFEVNKELRMGENLWESANDGVQILTETIENQSPAIDKMIGDYSRWKEGLLSLEMTSKQVAAMIRSSLTHAFSGLGKLIGRELANDNPKASLMMFLGGIASMVGEMAIALGTSMLTLFNLMLNPSPALALALIAGGVGLVALGSYAQSTAAQIADSSNSAGGGQTAPRFADRELVLNGQWSIRGADLVYVLDKQGYRSSTVGG